MLLFMNCVLCIINRDNLTWPSTASEGVSLFRTLDEKQSKFNLTEAYFDE